MLTQEKRFQPILTRREDKIQKYKVKVQAVACKNPRICVVILSENVIWRSDEAWICIRQRFLLSIWSFTLFSNYRLRFSARAMNRRQIVSRCGGMQKCVYEFREFLQSLCQFAVTSNKISFCGRFMRGAVRLVWKGGLLLLEGKLPFFLGQCIIKKNNIQFRKH